LSELGKITSITTTISTHPKIEYGCKITQTSTSKQEIKYIWDKLKEKYNFNCSHIEVIDKYNGCILDYLSH